MKIYNLGLIRTIYRWTCVEIRQVIQKIVTHFDGLTSLFSRGLVRTFCYRFYIPRKRKGQHERKRRVQMYRNMELDWFSKKLFELFKLCLKNWLNWGISTDPVIKSTQLYLSFETRINFQKCHGESEIGSWIFCQS